MHSLKLTRIGNSTGVTLPKEVLDSLHAVRGDTVHLTKTPDGFQISAYDPEFADQVEVAEAVMRRRRNVLKKLAE